VEAATATASTTASPPWYAGEAASVLTSAVAGVEGGGRPVGESMRLLSA
jgi:hypothetical protein